MIENNTTDQKGIKRRVMDIPELRRVDVNTGFECLMLGLRDFRDAPKYGLFFGGVYALSGWLVAWLLFIVSMPYFAYPAALGFAFVAPFVATGIYEVSRRLEKDQPLSWNAILGTVWRQQDRDMGWMALVTGFAFFIWVNYAAIVYLLFFGLRELQLENFISSLTTTKGLYFLLLGNFVGAVLAAIVFSVGVISFPLLLDREIDFVTAMTTSVKAVAMNPVSMFMWAVIIALFMLVSIISVFITLPVILPVIGHASWHMYRKVVVRASQEEAPSL